VRKEIMFCPNCGSEISDSAVICPSCGSNVAESNSTANGGVASLLEGKGNKTIIAAIAAVAAVVVIVLVVIIATLFGGSYKTPVKKMVKLINKQEESGYEYVSLYSAPYEATYYKTANKIFDKCDDYTDSFGKAKDEYENEIDSFEEYFGDNYKITIKEIKNVDKIDKDDVKDYQESIREVYEDKDDVDDAIDYMQEHLEDYEDDYDLSSKDSKKILKAYKKFVKAKSKAKVSAGYEATIEFKIKGSEGSSTYKAKNVEIYKINGKWVCDSLSPYSLLEGFMDSDDFDSDAYEY